MANKKLDLRRDVIVTKDFLTRAEICAITGVSRATLFNRLKEHNIKEIPSHFKQKKVYKIEDIEKLFGITIKEGARLDAETRTVVEKNIEDILREDQ